MFFPEWATFHFEADEDKKKKLRETFLNETSPYYLSRLESIVEKNGGFLALGRVRAYFLSSLDIIVDNY